MKHLVYGVLGTGGGEDRIIEESLADLRNINELVVVGKRKSTNSEKVVYNWMLDNSVDYTLLADMYSPKVLNENATKIIESSGDHVTEMLDYLDANDGALLLLWDDSEETKDIVRVATEKGIKIYELNNGLVPVANKVEKIKEKVAKQVPATDVEVEPFTEDELLEMPINVLKRQIKSLGFNSTPKDTKRDLVDKIIGVREDEPVKEPTYSNAVVVLFGKDGAVKKTMALSPEQIDQLLGACS